MGRQVRILDFDIENRPLTYLGQDFTTSDITAIAAGWADKNHVAVRLLGVVSQFEMLEWFRLLYVRADLVTGHYIIKHDLPIINGALMEHGLPPLPPKLVCDTKIHLKRRSGISASQESLAGVFGIKASKVHMTQQMWREGNRLTDEGIEYARKRVVGDVRQHKLLRLALLEAGMLGPPKEWRP